MGSDVIEDVHGIPSPHDIKVHRGMCTKLMKLVERITEIFPEIEATRPRCSTGIKALCSLNSAIEKAKLLLQYCSESSKLYLSLTGDRIMSRCKNSRNLLEQSLSQIQNNVPVLLGAEISRIIADLRDATFSLDPIEEEAGKAVKTLLQHASAEDSVEESTTKAIQFVVSRLHLTSQKDLLIEKRSIRKLLNKVSDNDQKKQILVFLLVILKKYDKSIKKMQTENFSVHHQASFTLPRNRSIDTKNTTHTGSVSEARSDYVLSGSVPPEEYRCPLSLRLMYDPVVIDSGQTFERMWIQKWFNEGHNTCPKTNRKLAHLSLTPNTVMKDLITKWCSFYGVAVVDPNTQSDGAYSWENSSTSIASLSNSMKDLYLPLDLSNMSLGSLDISQGSDYSSGKINNEDLYRTRSNGDKCENEMEFLKKLDGLPWESRCKGVENFNEDDFNVRVMTSENFVKPLFRFLNDAVDLIDVKAQRSGCLLLLAFLKKCRNSIPDVHEDAYALLASFLDSEVTEEALAIMEILSRFRHCIPKIAESGALTYIINLLETERGEFREASIKILYELTSNSEICSLIASSKLIPSLVPFLEYTDISRYCIYILSKLCDHPEARVAIIQTKGCIASIAKILESDNCEEQEHAVSIFLSLCCQRDEYCQMIMKEGVIPSLVSITVNGNDRGKTFAHELLRILRDVVCVDDVEESPVRNNNNNNNLDLQRENVDQCRENKSSSRARGLLGKMSMFSKASPLTPKKKK